LSFRPFPTGISLRDLQRREKLGSDDRNRLGAQEEQSEKDNSHLRQFKVESQGFKLRLLGSTGENP
jgi:hypothetical protein